MTREKIVTAAAALTLAVAPWLFGGVIAWTLHVLLAGGLLTLLLALIPWRTGPGGRLESGLSSLLRSPSFYFALAFLAYLAVAAVNPAWVIASDPRGWWLAPEPSPPVSWLPTSVESPYEPMNAWRIFNMHLAAFSLALGVKVGLRRRTHLLCILWVFLLSTAAMAAVAIYQKYTGAALVLWTYESENQNFWGSFFYRNQGAAFLNWGLFVAGLLYFIHSARSRIAGRSGGPHFLAFCLLGLIVVSVALALSRGGILFAAILAGVFLILAVVNYLYHTLTQFSQHTIWVTVTATAALIALLVLGLYQGYRLIDWPAVEKRFGSIETTLENADRDARVLSSRLTWKMAREELWTGWGPGSFRYVFPMYQKEEPRIFYQYKHPKHGWVGRQFYRYAHNDLLQFLAEYGAVGSGLLLAFVLSLLLPALSALRRLPAAVLFLFLAFTGVLGHAFLDFIFHSPAFWVVFIGGLAMAARLLQLEARRG